MQQKFIKTAICNIIFGASALGSALAYSYNIFPGETSREYVSVEGGRAVAVSGRYTALGAEGASTPKDNGSTNGAIYIYRDDDPQIHRTYQFFETLPSSVNNRPEDLFSIGRLGKRLAMNDDFLVSTWFRPTDEYGKTPAIVIFKSDNGVWPTCPNNNCVVDSSDLNNVQYADNLKFLDDAYIREMQIYSSDNMSISLSGARIAVGAYSHSGDGAVVIYDYIEEFDYWRPKRISNFGENDHFGRSVAIDDDFLVVGAPKDNNGVGRVYLYQYTDGEWNERGSYAPPDATDMTGFGTEVDLSGNDLIIGSADKTVSFLTIEQLSQSTGTGEYCRTNLSVPIVNNTDNIAIDNGRAVVVDSGIIGTSLFQKNNTWSMVGGLTHGIYPETTEESKWGYTEFWAAAIKGDKLAMGWRNYDPISSTNNPSGAVVTANFDDLLCDQTLLKPVSATASSIENGNYVAANAIDGKSWTRWSSQFSDPTLIDIDYGEDRVFDKIVLSWESAYSSHYRLDVSYDGVTYRTFFEQTNGQGGTEVIDSSSFSDARPAFGRYLRITSLSRATPWGNSLWEVAAYQPLSQHCPSTALPCEPAYFDAPRDTRQQFTPQNGQNFVISHVLSNGKQETAPVISVEGRADVSGQSVNLNMFRAQEGQIFRLKDKGGIWSLSPVENLNLCLQAPQTLSGAPITPADLSLASCSTSHYQSFFITHLGNSHFELYNRGARVCMSVRGNDSKTSGYEIIGSCSGSNAWTFLKP